MRPAFDALLGSLVWPAAAAVSLAVAAVGADATAAGLVLLACGTAAAYGLDRLVDHWPHEPPAVRFVVLAGCGACGVVAGVLALTAVWRVEVCLVLGVLAGGYVPLKRVIPKNLIVTAAWTVAVCTLPLAVAPPLDGRYAAAAGCVALVLLANTTLCDLDSVEADRAAGVRGFAPRFGRRPAAVAAGLVAVAGVALAVAHRQWGLAATASALAGLAVFLRRWPGQHGLRWAVDAVLLALPGPVHALAG